MNVAATKPATRALGAGVGCLFALLVAVSPSKAADETYDFAGDDPAMNAAIADAKARLPNFFDAVQAPDTLQPMLKVGVETSEAPGSYEHVWTSDCQASETHDFACVVMNDPRTRAIKKGELHHFDIAEISDWAYFDAEGRMHGAYTIRVILPELPEDQADHYRAMLAPLPE